MSKQTIADFEAEIQEICEKYRDKLAHAELVGVLGIIQHIYMDAQINNKDCIESCTIKDTSPSPKEIKDAKKEES